MRKAKVEYYKNRIGNQKKNPKQAWKAVNDILGRGRKDIAVNEIKIGQGTILSPTKIAECFNDYFVNAGPTIASSIDIIDGCKSNFEHYIDNISFTFQAINHSNVFKLFNELVVSKATGVDKIPAKVLKLAAPVITNSIIKIINCSIETGEFSLD